MKNTKDYVSKKKFKRNFVASFFANMRDQIIVCNAVIHAKRYNKLHSRYRRYWSAMYLK